MSLQDGKKSIWDDLPDEWKTETTQHDIQKSGADDAQPVYQPEFPSDDDSVPDEVNNASRSVNEETSELQDTFSRPENTRKKKRKIDKKKYKEFEERYRENRYNSSEKAKQAYQKEKKQNKKDFTILGVASAFIVIGIVIFIYMFTGTSNQRIYDLIDSGNYGTAYQNISERYDAGKNVDTLVYTFAESCVSNNEYKRAVASLEMLSDDAQNHGEFFSELIESLSVHEKYNRAQEVLEFMYERGGNLSTLADELSKSYE